MSPKWSGYPVGVPVEGSGVNLICTTVNRVEGTTREPGTPSSIVSFLLVTFGDFIGGCGVGLVYSCEKFYSVGRFLLIISGLGRNFWIYYDSTVRWVSNTLSGQNGDVLGLYKTSYCHLMTFETVCHRSYVEDTVHTMETISSTRVGTRGPYVGSYVDYTRKGRDSFFVIVFVKCKPPHLLSCVCVRKGPQ